MTSKEAVNWLINLTADIGKSEHHDLWHYEQALSEIKEMLEGKDTDVPSKDTISRKQAIDRLETIGYDFSDSGLSEIELEEVCEAVGDVRQDMIRMIKQLPSAQPTEASCWGCNCPKMERLKEQKTFSEMVHLHDAETHDKRTETHACDLISRQAAIDAVDIKNLHRGIVDALQNILSELPSAQPERPKGKWIEFIPEHGECPFCGNQVDLLNGKANNFCGECGADMRGEQDE